MKSYRLKVSWALAALLVLVTSRSRAEGPLVAYPAGAELSKALVLVPEKSTREEVVALLGEPPEHLSANVWVYWDFRSNQPARTGGFDTLVISFKGERVSELKIVNGTFVRQYIAERGRRNPSELLTPLSARRLPSRR